MANIYVDLKSFHANYLRLNNFLLTSKSTLRILLRKKKCFTQATYHQYPSYNLLFTNKELPCDF